MTMIMGTRGKSNGSGLQGFGVAADANKVDSNIHGNWARLGALNYKRYEWYLWQMLDGKMPQYEFIIAMYQAYLQNALIEEFVPDVVENIPLEQLAKNTSKYLSKIKGSRFDKYFLFGTKYFSLFGGSPEDTALDNQNAYTDLTWHFYGRSDNWVGRNILDKFAFRANYFFERTSRFTVVNAAGYKAEVARSMDVRFPEFIQKVYKDAIDAAYVINAHAKGRWKTALTDLGGMILSVLKGGPTAFLSYVKSIEARADAQYQQIQKNVDLTPQKTAAIDPKTMIALGIGLVVVAGIAIYSSSR